jgi:hypothetical protein
MKSTTIKQAARITAAIGLILGAFSAHAVTWDPPGSHTYWLDYANPTVPQNIDKPRYFNAAPSLLFGRDFIFGGKGAVSWQYNKQGYMPIAVSPALYASACNSGSCAVTVDYGTDDCTTQQTTYGVSFDSGDLPVINFLSFSRQSSIETKSCSSRNSSASQSISKSTLTSGKKAYAVLGMGYRKGTMIQYSTKVYFNPTITAAAATNSTVWTPVYNLCKALGWKGNNNNGQGTQLELAGVVRYSGYCVVNQTKAYTNGPHPYELIATYPVISDTTNIVAGRYVSGSNW